MTIETLAAEMNQTVADTTAFVACLSVWTSKGYSIEEAIAKHMGQMERFVNASTNPAMKEIVIESYDELRAKGVQ